MSYDLSKKCKSCNITFWHSNPATEFCGDSDCNKQNSLQKTLLLSKNLSFAEVFRLFQSYYKQNYAFCEAALSLPRSSTNTKVSSTNMNFISAGISTYETLLDSQNPRLAFFSNKLLISTPFCFRFNDLENVGTTKRHNTGFFMFSLHCFESLQKKFPENWKELFLDIFVNFFLHLGVPLEKIYLNKDVWTDSVNSGECVEIFINGMEIGNMVYITEKKGKARELKLLDVGLGGQRIHKLLTGHNSYTENIVKDHLRSLIIAFKDKLYPCKTGPGY